jgi:hypothetical protein
LAKDARGRGAWPRAVAAKLPYGVVKLLTTTMNLHSYLIPSCFLVVVKLTTTPMYLLYPGMKVALPHNKLVFFGY